MKSDRKERNDKILISCIIIMAVLLGVFFVIKGSTTGTTVVVSVDGEEYGRYSLMQEQVVQINDTNTLVIHDQCADMLFGDCPDQVCVNHTPIHKNGETIICLPNRVIVTIESLLQSDAEDPELDAVVK